jgi:hypothetical protein
MLNNTSQECLKQRDHSEDLGVDGKIILEWLLGKVWAGCVCLGIGTSECGKEPFRFLKSQEIS